jgi:methionyl-tRNA synthetase
MRIMSTEKMKFSPAFGIDMAAIDTFVGGDLAAGFGRVAPGQETTPHQHDEVEAFVILRGQGEIVVDNVPHSARPGVVAVFEPFETHVLRNCGEVELLFLDLYRRDAAQAARAAKETGAQRFADRPVFVFSTPPTPNGDLHLGHLSGPYLAADVFVRFQRLNGVESYHLTGSDDFQSYVVGRARQEGKKPGEVAAHYAAEIRATLELMDIPIDQFTITGTDRNYPAGLRDFFSRVIASGAVVKRRGDALFDGENGAYLYEVDVGGKCPTCGSPTNGNICEECGEPNTCVEILDPKSKLSDTSLRRGTIERYSLPLHRFKDVVQDHHRRGKVSPRLQDLAARIFAKGEIDLPMTHPSRWGVRPAEDPEGEQVIWVWPEMAYGFLHGIAELGHRLGRDWAADQPRDDWKIVHFFGYDNSFYHTVLYPILYKLAFPNWQNDIEYNVNEFYLLDGQKFSTSRRHAIWGKDILTPQTVDAVRYYLALTRGEIERTNFEFEAFQRAVSEVLIGKWQAWLADLGTRVATGFGGLAPDAGIWSPGQSAFLGRLQARLDAISVHYGADGFSLNGVVREMNGLVEDTLRFVAANRSLAVDAAAHDEWRTAVALELASAQFLAQCARPVMPRFSERLAEALGGSVEAVWPTNVKLVPAGTAINLMSVKFFSVPELVQPSKTVRPRRLESAF